MALSPFDRRLLSEGLEFFTRPRLANLFEMLGSSKGERVDALAVMLRNSSPEEIDEALDILDRAMARVAREVARERRRGHEGRGRLA